MKRWLSLLMVVMLCVGFAAPAVQTDASSRVTVVYKGKTKSFSNKRTYAYVNNNKVKVGAQPIFMKAGCYMGPVNKLFKKSSLKVSVKSSGNTLTMQYRSNVTFIAQLMGISWGALAGAFLAPFLYGLYWKKATKAGCWASFLFSVVVMLANMLAMDICKRNRVIFSCVCQAGESVTEVGMSFVEHLGCLVLCLPPMRQCTAQIPAAANMCLSNLNTELTKQLLGLESGAVQLLQEFDWPGNHAQFQRILRELAIDADGPYITQEDTTRILQRERTVALEKQRNESGGLLLNLEGTLDQINQQIIHRVLEEEDGNQSRTARRLGISRTTLWRLLNNQ